MPSSKVVVKAIVLASGNRGKLTEFSELLAPYCVSVLPQTQFVSHGAEETGATFIENALLKARHASKAAGLAAIADDSGIEVDALQGAPGVYSARFAGENATDDQNNQKLLAELEDLPIAKRTARFQCALAYVRNADDSLPLIAQGVWEGRILTQSRGAYGFGYDSLFLPLDSEHSAAEMTREIKNQRSHRAQALRELMRLLAMHHELD